MSASRTPSDADINDALGDASEHLSVEFDDGIAVVEFRRPDKHNAISYAMWSALARVLPLVGSHPDVDVVLFRGTPGGPFSAGADIAEFRTLRADAAGAEAYGAAVEAGEAAIMALPQPTIAAIEGFAIGGGTQVAIACDLRVCGESSRFGITPAKLGIVYALPSTARLVDVVGAAWARWILLTGELVSADVAARIGLVHEVVPDDDVMTRGVELARSVSSRARVSVRGGKALIDRVATGRCDVDDDVLALYHDALVSAEYREGIAAFLEKRPADFRTVRHAHNA